MPDLPVTTVITEVIEKYADDLIALRRDLHAHPELSWGEARTSERVVSALDGSGWSVHRIDGGGVIAEIGSGDRLVALRADLDALPIDDLVSDPWKSTVSGVAHACGHDVHTAGLVGAGLALAEVSARGLLPGRVRLLFQPAEEVMPGGALHLLAAGALRDVDHVFGLHCDPSLDVGRIGLREGPLTGAADSLTVRVVGKGGHTSRPHLTEDLTFALGKLITELPAILSRRLDPRAGVSVVWGMVRAGSAPNVIPHAGIVAGTTSQSLGGEDFGWYLDSVSGAMARLGTRTPGGATYDLHQGNLRIDEAATPIASRVLAEAAVTALVG